MADHTPIEWTDATWNPITGCSVVSAGCKHCYAIRLAGTRLQHHPSRVGLTTMTKAGPVWNGDVRFNDQWLDQPLRWRRPRRIFVCAHGDLFHPAVPDQWIDRVFAVMAMAPQHTFQVLTKRPERMVQYFLSAPYSRWLIIMRGLGLGRDRLGSELSDDGALPNVWLGVSVEDQAAADERIPLLLQTPATVRWISAEPLLGPVNLDLGWRNDTGRWDSQGRELPLRRIDWVVAGGESGTGARPMHPDWPRSLRDQCAAAGVPFLFKQWGDWRPINQGPGDWYEPLYRSRRKARDGESQAAIDDVYGQMCTVPELCLRSDGAHCSIIDTWAWRAGTSPMQAFQVGKKVAGRLLDGVQHDGYPQ